MGCTDMACFFQEDEPQLHVLQLNGHIFFQGRLVNFIYKIIHEKNRAWKLIINESSYSSLYDLVYDKLPELVSSGKNCINATIVFYQDNNDKNFIDINYNWPNIIIDLWCKPKNFIRIARGHECVFVSPEKYESTKNHPYYNDAIWW